MKKILAVLFILFSFIAVSCDGNLNNPKRDLDNPFLSAPKPTEDASLKSKTKEEFQKLGTELIYNGFTSDFCHDSEVIKINLSEINDYIAGDKSFSLKKKTIADDVNIDIVVCGFKSDADDKDHKSYIYWGNSTFSSTMSPEKGELIIKTENQVYKVEFETNTIEEGMASFNKLIINGVDLNTLNDT